jgi:hypothetical protein
MKEPINFSSRVNGTTIFTNGNHYELKVNTAHNPTGFRTVMWIVPMAFMNLVPNYISIVFNWKVDKFDIMVINRNNGNLDSHRCMRDQPMHLDAFKTFDIFISQVENCIDNHKDLFY